MAFSSTPEGFGLNHFQASSWATSRALVDPRFVVLDESSQKPVVTNSADRSVIVTSGEAVACGIRGMNTTSEPVQFASNTGLSDRWDALVARYNWSTNSIALRAIAGGSTPPAIVTSGGSDAAKINRLPSVMYDALIGIVRVRPNVGVFAASDLTDMRVWGSAGALVTNATGHYDMIDVPSGGILSVPSGTSRKLIHKPATVWEDVDRKMRARRRLVTASGDLTVGAVANLASPETLPAAPFGPGVPYRVKVVSQVRVDIPSGGGVELETVIGPNVFSSDWEGNGGARAATTLKGDESAYIENDAAQTVTVKLRGLAGTSTVTAGGDIIIEAIPYDLL